MNLSAPTNIAGKQTTTAMKQDATPMMNHTARKLENARAIAYLQQLWIAHTIAITKVIITTPTVGSRSCKMT
jgi:hypothetical protein